MTTILLIIDAATDGKMKTNASGKAVYGWWNPNLIFVIWAISGISYGMVELVRRVIPADIFGVNVRKLRRMDAIVHFFYEITGTAGAFPSSSAISRFGNNYSFFLTSVLFTFAAVAWIFIGTLNVNSTSLEDELRIEGRKKNYLVQIWHRVLHFFESVYYGAILVLSRRHFI